VRPAQLLVSSVAVTLRLISRGRILNIFVVTWVQKATYMVMGIVVLYGLWLVMSTIVHCIPVYFFSDTFVSDRKCFNLSAKWTADAAVSLSLEVMIFCLLLPVLGSLTLPRRQKLWVCFAFSLGIL
jgi:hypothetical protein